MMLVKSALYLKCWALHDAEKMATTDKRTAMPAILEEVYQLMRRDAIEAAKVKETITT
jgi:hypothetical protein